MLKITAIGNLTNDIELKKSETTGVPYVILRIASDRIYRDKDGNQITDFISIKAHGRLAERCVEFAWKGCRWRRSGILRRSPPRRKQSSQASSSGHATWNSCHPESTRKRRKERRGSDLGDEK